MEAEKSDDSGLRIATEVGDGLPLVTLGGELTIATAHELTDRMTAELANKLRAVAVDAGGLTFMDSTGLSAVIRLHREAQRLSVALSFAGFRDAPRKVLELTRLDLVLELQASVAKARRAAGKRSARRS